jgi:hypothetical protein
MEVDLKGDAVARLLVSAFAGKDPFLEPPGPGCDAQQLERLGVTPTLKVLI